VRDLGTIAGIAVILAGVVGLNIYYRLEGLTQKFDRIRRGAEATRAKSGMDMLDWELLRETKGSLRSGPTFDTQLVARAQDGRTANLMGFMTPIDQFRNVSHFMLLPLPIECYFCQMPPMRDVMLVRLMEGELTNIAPEPVLVTGKLELHDGPKQKFFYSMTNSTIQAGNSGQRLSIKNFSQEHREQGYKEGPKLLQEGGAGPGTVPEDELLPGEKAGTPAAAELPATVPAAAAR
jgi:hypothetical protein